MVNGPVAHLFYDGPVKNHDFRNFEFKADVMTFPKANSGIYIHTKFQASGFPKIGYEVQINNSHSDPRRTGRLYKSRTSSRCPPRTTSGTAWRSPCRASTSWSGWTARTWSTTPFRAP